ncbi:MAG: UvrB/UvrC motif-containing protein, partial [Selenomonadaceae bacterium]|nr:UvrB/UvrC motif-containing protein [Selenomonadaceae bacterium]
TIEMKQASKSLEFERAATLRDMILELEGTLPKINVKNKK